MPRGQIYKTNIPVTVRTLFGVGINTISKILRHVKAGGKLVAGQGSLPEVSMLVWTGLAN
ncbi:MAG: hypothetical protein Q8862_02400 [Bacteroidota bacterium]|nr:hypothetical protein [Bacteroidota bacterium]